MICNCARAFFLSAILLLIGCAHEPQVAPGFAGREVALAEVSHEDCLDLEAVIKRLREIDPGILARRSTVDVQVELAPDTCKGTEAHITQGNLRWEERPLATTLSTLDGLSQLRCEEVHVVDSAGGQQTYKVIEHRKNMLKVQNDEGDGFGMEWVSPESFHLTHHYQAVNFRRPRIGEKLNAHQVEVTEILRWDADAFTPEAKAPVSNRILRVLQDALLSFPRSLTPVLASYTEDSTSLNPSDFLLLQKQILKPDYQVCDPYTSEAPPPEALGESRGDGLS